MSSQYSVEKGKSMSSGGSMSAGRVVLLAVFIILLALVALGLGLGFAIKEMLDMKETNCTNVATIVQLPEATTTTTTTTTQAPAGVSRNGNYRFGGVAADSGQCSEIGTSMMARGGSAVDVAIATMLCGCAVVPHSCGIGGGHFMTFYRRVTVHIVTSRITLSTEAKPRLTVLFREGTICTVTLKGIRDNKAFAIMAREMAPGAATQLMFQNESSQLGGLSITTPGEIMGYWEAHKLGGRLPWSQLFTPTIDLCTNGFKVENIVAEQIEIQKVHYNRFVNLRNMVTNPATGAYYKAGETMKLPKLAQTLQKIADEGAITFYNGSLATDIVADIQEAGGIVTLEDLRKYTATVKDPLVVSLHGGYRVLAPPPPSGGVVAEFILGILNGFDFNAGSISRQNRGLTWHRIIEAFKFGFAKRSNLGDSDVENADFKNEMQQLIKNMTSPEFVNNVRQKITDDRTHGYQYYGPTFQLQQDSGTSHLSVMSPGGDAVSITSTINLYYGSKVVGTRTGIVFNDQMDDFSTPNKVNFFGVPASPANFIKPYKRPLSSMSPLIITDINNDAKLVAGAAGGTKIITATTLTAIASLWFDKTLQQAIDTPRGHHQLIPDKFTVEPDFPQDVIDVLRAKGHTVEVVGKLATVQGVLRVKDNNNKYINLEGCSDWRKGGVPDGF